MSHSTPEQTRRRKVRELRAARGLPNRHPAEAVIPRIRELRQTMSWSEVTSATGCSAARLRGILAGRATTINNATYVKIMTAKPVPPGPWRFIPAAGSSRRVRALMAIGHSWDTIAAVAGAARCRIGRLAHGPDTTRRILADKVAAAYAALAHTPGTSTRARTIARQQGWQDPAFWDDYGSHIDDPDFDPATADASAPSRGAVLAEDGRWLEAQGYTRGQAAERLGVAKNTLQKAMERYPASPEEAAA